MPSAVQVVLLDLGGVLLNLHDPLVTFGLELRQDEFLESWLLSPSVRKFERGEVDISQFASDMVAEFALPYTPTEFARRFESWPDALYNGVPDLLKSIARRHQVAVLSNTNEVHWHRDDISGQLVPLLHAVFLSYQTRHLKPEPDAFENVLQHFGIAADEFLFLDDNPLNIAAARKCGMQARLTNGFESLIQNLSQAGITKTPT